MTRNRKYLVILAGAVGLAGLFGAGVALADNGAPAPSRTDATSSVPGPVGSGTDAPATQGPDADNVQQGDQQGPDTHDDKDAPDKKDAHETPEAADNDNVQAGDQHGPDGPDGPERPDAPTTAQPPGQ